MNICASKKRTPGKAAFGVTTLLSFPVPKNQLSCLQFKYVNYTGYDRDYYCVSVMSLMVVLIFINVVQLLMTNFHWRKTSEFSF